MKKLFGCLLSLCLFACGGKNNNDDTPTVPGPNPACMNGTAYCNNQAYSYYPGFQPYPNSYGNNYWSSSWGTSGFCNCPAGSMPTYNSMYGLGCVNTNQFNYNFSLYAWWGWGATNTQWTRNPISSNITGYNSLGGGGCFNSAVESCMTNIANSCGPGRICQPTAASGTLGLCTIRDSSFSGWGR